MARFGFCHKSKVMMMVLLMKWLVPSLWFSSCVFVHGNSVITFGNDLETKVYDFVQDVTALSMTDKAVAMLREDGTVFTVGEANFGGDSSNIDFAAGGGVAKVYGNRMAFAAIKKDGSVVTWPQTHPWSGGDSSSVDFSKGGGIDRIFHNDWSFVAVHKDRKVTAWGDKAYGGDASTVDFGDGVKYGCGEISASDPCCVSNEGAHACILANGKVVSWGHENYGGSLSTVANAVESGAEAIFAAKGGSFAAILGPSRTLVSWGNPRFSDTSSVVSQLRDIQGVASTYDAWAAWDSLGTVITFGDPTSGGDSSTVSNVMQRGVTNIFANPWAFAALKRDKSLVVWGDRNLGGDPGDHDLSGDIREVISNGFGFAALTFSKTVKTWGKQDYGGDTTTVGGRLRKIGRVYSNRYSYLAVRDDLREITSWGAAEADTATINFRGRVQQVYSSNSNYAMIVD